ncbi:MAG: hypothetical protein HYX80_06085 [Chloroflexi bacterium]|nr:hypothetical protein [Chloroflexota bacterium]
MAEKRVADSPAAEMAVRRALETKFGERLKSVAFRKCWYSAAGEQEFWDVEGTLVRKKGIITKEIRNFRYQIDPDSGNILGYEENIPK